MKGLYKMNNNNTERNNDIRINKKMRTWNKYKNYVFAVAGVIVAILFITIVVKSCGKKDNDDGTIITQVPTQSTQNTQPETTIPTQQDTQSAEPTTVAPTQSTTAKAYTTSKTVTSEEFTSQDFYTGSVFLGDAIVSGMEYYGNLSEDQVVADGNITTDKALKSVDEVVAKNPSKVFIMIGINELNYPRTADAISSSYKTLVDELKSKLPTAQIYAVSVLPITKSYESKTSVKIEKSNLDALNENLKELVTTDNINYVDIASAFKDGSGYLNETVTSNGLNLNSGYYGFLLNAIAEMIK